MERLLGSRIGNYALTRIIGEGTMGVVYLAEHDRIERRKAVKVLRREWSESPDRIRRFFSEAVAASSCQHEHIVAVDDCGSFAAAGEVYHYILMELLEGHDLLREKLVSGRIEPRRAVKIAVYAAAALEAAHRRGIIHRDLKPANIFLARRGDRRDYVKVLDFGVARLLGPLAPGSRTRSGHLIGTPAYMSPEQVRGRRADARSDIYSLGVVLYEVLSGGVPFAGGSLAALAEQIISREPEPIAELCLGLAPGVARAVGRALAKRSDERFPSMQDFAAALVAEDAVPEALAPELSIELPRAAERTADDAAPQPIAPDETRKLVR